MSAFKIEIATNNAAFTYEPTGEESWESRAEEVGRILQELGTMFLTERSPRNGETGKLVDYNGNTVGSWEFTDE